MKCNSRVFVSGSLKSIKKLFLFLNFQAMSHRIHLFKLRFLYGQKNGCFLRQKIPTSVVQINLTLLRIHSLLINNLALQFSGGS